MLSESDAKNTRCCGAEGCGAVGPDGLRWCIASECMAWRWDEEGGTAEWNERVQDYVLTPMRKSSTHGYCRLAGKP